jgi:hypothetical protein
MKEIVMVSYPSVELSVEDESFSDNVSNFDISAIVGPISLLLTSAATSSTLIRTGCLFEITMEALHTN